VTLARGGQSPRCPGANQTRAGFAAGLKPDDRMTDLLLQELPSLLERVRPRLKEQDYRRLEGMVQILQELDQQQWLGVAPEKLAAAVAEAERRLALEPSPGIKPPVGTPAAPVPPPQNSTEPPET
jgi:hypothetical protein